MAERSGGNIYLGRSIEYLKRVTGLPSRVRLMYPGVYLILSNEVVEDGGFRNVDYCLTRTTVSMDRKKKKKKKQLVCVSR